MLEIQTKQLPPDITVLGRITIGRDCKELEWAVENLVKERRKKVIVDLTGVTHIDSTGIGIVVMSAGQIKKVGCELRVAGATTHVEDVLKLRVSIRLSHSTPTPLRRLQTSDARALLGRFWEGRGFRARRASVTSAYRCCKVVQVGCGSHTPSTAHPE